MEKETLTRRLIQEISNKITSGELKPGEKLTSERELAAHYGVTRSRLREALSALEITGVITIKPGGGSFITENTENLPLNTMLLIYHKEVHNYDEIYKARCLIETEVYLECFHNRNEEIINSLLEASDFLNTDDVIEMSAKDYQDKLDKLDLCVGRICGNAIYSKLMQTIVLLRREYAEKMIGLHKARANSILYRLRTVDSFIKGDEKKLKKALADNYRRSVSKILGK